MALIPNRYATHTLEGYESQSLFTEGNMRTVISEGWYRHPSLEEDRLLERTTVTINQHGSEMHKVIESWDIERPKGPPKQYHKEIWSKAYIPRVNPGRALSKMEEETTVFWCQVPYCPDALAYRRQVDAMVIYNLKPLPYFEFDDQANVVLRGLEASGATEEDKRLHIASAKMWNEAVKQGTTVEKVDANQRGKWVKGVIVEEVSVAEEPDRYTQWGWRKHTLRPDDIEYIGPTYFQKESWNYALDVPVDPPTIEARDAGEDGVRLRVRGGGAVISIPLTTGARKYDRGPDEYRIFRRVIEEAEREPGEDPFGIWEEDPPDDARRSVIVNVFVGGYDGTPDPENGLPTQTSYTEPHDPSPLLDDDWTMVGTAPNEAEDKDRETGYATLYDADVTTDATYLYAAIAVVQETESAMSNQDEVTFSGSDKRGPRIVVRTRPDGSIEGDLVMPNDPAIALDPDVGAVFDFDVPAYVEDLGMISFPLDTVTLTVAEQVDVEEETFYTTPHNVPEVWTAGRIVQVTDIVDPGRPDSTGQLRRFAVRGTIVSATETSVVVTGLNADKHMYPIGALVEPQADGTEDDQRIVSEMGDSEEPTIEALVLAVGTRQGLRSKDESFSIGVTVNQPLLGLQAGAEVILTDIAWDAWGNDLWMQSMVEEVPWVLRGWAIEVSRSESGEFACSGTDLVLEQR
jgi:hypothetical protein